MSPAIVHLDSTRAGDVAAACGVMSKFRTRNATAVTCPECESTWDYAALIDHLVANFPREGKQ